MNVLTMTTVCLLLAADPAPDAAKADVARLQGEWVMASGERDGQPIPDDFLKQFHRTCKDDVTTVTHGGQPFLHARFSLDPAKSPKTIDYTLLDGPDKGKTQPGIYKVDGDTV